MNPSEKIDQQIKDAGGWKADILTQLRGLIHEADPEIQEDWKWDTAVFAHNGIICAISSFKDHVKINFFKGYLLKDNFRVINSGLESKSHRGVDYFENDKVNSEAIKNFVKQAVDINSSKK